MSYIMCIRPHTNNPPSILIICLLPIKVSPNRMLMLLLCILECSLLECNDHLPPSSSASSHP